MLHLEDVAKAASMQTGVDIAKAEGKLKGEVTDKVMRHIVTSTVYGGVLEWYYESVKPFDIIKLLVIRYEGCDSTPKEPEVLAEFNPSAMTYVTIAKATLSIMDHTI